MTSAAPAPSLETQLQTLAQCGIRARPEVTVEHLLEQFSREEYEREPYKLLITVLGDEGTIDNLDRLSDDIWHFDTECIEDHGAYVRIVERVRDLADGDLPITDIKDEVDIEAGKASLEFRLNGLAIKWNLTVSDDWTDPKIFTRFAQLLEKCRSKRRLTYLDLGGQDCIIGCTTPEGLAMLTKATGLKFTLMT